MGRKKILLIIPELTMGGAQRSLTKLSLELAQHHDVWVVIFNRRFPVAYTYGGTLVSLDVHSGDSLRQKARALLQRIRRLRKLKKQLGVEVAISFLEGADYINVLSARGEKVILSIRGSKHHDEIMHGNFYWLRDRVLIPWLYRKADRIVAVNQGIARELQAYGVAPGRCVVIGNYYDAAAITQAAGEPNPGNLARLYNDPVLITTGRLAPEKGLKSLIRIFHELNKTHTRLRLMIVGDGPLKSELITLASDLGLTVYEGLDFEDLPDVVFAGNQANVFKFLKGATLYLMNSSSEGFPNGMAEAMICGVPVASSDCPYGPREILAPELPFAGPVTRPYLSNHGILMPMIRTGSDRKVWVDLLGDVLDKKELLAELAAKGKQRMSTFEAKVIISQWHAIL